MIYNLYFESNKQAQIAHLEENCKHITEYLTINTNGHDEILTMEKSPMLVSSTSLNDDKHVYVSEIILRDNIVEIIFDEKKNINISCEKNQYIRVNEIKNNITIENLTEGSKSYTNIEVIFVFGNFKSKVVVHCVPSQNLYDVVLDFGSEASQMLIRHNADGAGTVPQHLFANILQHYWQAVIGGQRRVYDQQDDNPELFRSIFFKKENAKMNDNFEKEEPSKDDAFLNFVTRRGQNSGERIPNVKISFLTGQELEGANRLRLHTGVIMRFLHEAVRRISEIQEEACGDNNISTGIRFTILLPNVMPQSNVSSLMSMLRVLANSKDFLSKYSDLITIPYIQVGSCSESDASFMERMNNVGLKTGDRCLTIDIGKGTTDFSITKYVNASTATSLFRSGFVGAGNAVSYAIFSHCIEQMAGKQKKKEIIKKVLDAEPALLFDLDNIIESLKHNWSKSSAQVNSMPTIESSASVEVILDRIRGLEGIGGITDGQTSKDDIKKMAESITDNIIERLPDLRINKIIISGRACKFEELRTVLSKRLEEKFKGVTCYYDNKSAKSGCLLGASSNIKLSSSSSMVGLPFILNASELDLSNPKKFIRDIAETAQTDKSVSNMPVTINTGKLASMAKVASSIASKLSDWFKNDDEEYSNGASRNIKPSKIADEAKELMSKGKEYSKINSNSLISISGRYYVPLDRYTIDDNDKPYQIYFDGDEFYLRHKTGCHQLVAAAMLGAQNLCFESQFPYSRSLYIDDSNIPD